MEKCVVIINKGGAIHSVPESLYKDNYRRNPDIRPVTKDELDKLSKLSETLSKALDTRHNAVKEDGSIDNTARSKAAVAVQKAKAAIEKYKAGLVDELS